VVSQTYENLTPNNAACPQINVAQNQYLINVTSFIDTKWPLAISGMKKLFNITDPLLISFYTNDFLCRPCHNMPLPTG
jgi:hypothetical protein